MRRNLETIESDPRWLQGIGPVKHHAYGNYYTNERGGMWIEEDIRLAVAPEDYNRWGLQAGVVMMRINEAKNRARQV